MFDNFLLEETDGTDVIADTNVVVQGDFIVADENLDVKAQDVIDGCISKEKGLNAESFLPWANSLVTIEFYRNLLQGGKILESQRTSSTSNYLAQSDYEMMATDDPSHRVFVNTFTFKDATKPAACVTGYIAINNECKLLLYNIALDKFLRVA